MIGTFNAILRWKAHKSFRRNCVLGNNFSCGPKASCYNESQNRTNINIGSNVEIMGRLITQGAGSIRIGKYTTIRYNSLIESILSVDIGDFVIISNNVIIADNNSHPTLPTKRKEMLLSGFCGPQWRWENAAAAPVVIGENVWIGRGSVVLKGVTVGHCSVVGCMAVVTKDVPPYSIVAGNPAKVVKFLYK